MQAKHYLEDWRALPETLKKPVRDVRGCRQNILQELHRMCSNYEVLRADCAE